MAFILHLQSPTGQPQPRRVIITGAPASGKGTQCERIVAKYGLVHLSTGDMLRAAVKEGSSVGLEAKGFMERGELVPDSIITSIVIARLDSDDCVRNGWLLDGFPRTEAQAIALQNAGITPSYVVGLEVPDDLLVERVISRRLDPVTGKIYNTKFKMPDSEEVVERLIQRADDTEAAVRTRLVAFHANYDALARAYPSISRVDGNTTPDAVWESVEAILEADPK